MIRTDDVLVIAAHVRDFLSQKFTVEMVESHYLPLSRVLDRLWSSIDRL